MAEKEGFEPSVQFPIRHISNVLVSTTHPLLPLRVISGLIATGEFLFPLSLTQIIVYVISGSQSSIFAIFFWGIMGQGLRGPLRFL